MRRGFLHAATLALAGAAVAASLAAQSPSAAAPLTELTRVLVANGLYEKEAQAMVETWQDSGFEEGSRLLYIVPRVDVDAILPLTIAPAPSAIARVFVGRIELVTPATIRDVTAAIASNDRAVLERYGRFLRPIAERTRLDAKLAPAPSPAAPGACR